MSTALLRVADESLANYLPESLVIPKGATTHDGFNRWVLSQDFPTQLRAAWIEGELYIEMSPEEIESHNRLKTELSRVIATLAKMHRLGTVYIDGVMYVNKRAKVSNEPDCMFVSKESLRGGKVVQEKSPKGKFMSLRGSPDWIAEIVSDSSVFKDGTKLKRCYERAGIKEYWLIDARRTNMSVQVFANSRNGFRSLRMLRGWWKSPVFKRRFCLRREIDEFGYWEYTLDCEDSA